MATVSAPTPGVAPKPRKSRRWLLVVGFVLLIAATPVVYYLVSSWLRERELQAVYAELDAEDPNWRWADLVAAMPAPTPDEQNTAEHVDKIRDKLGAMKFAKTSAWVSGAGRRFARMSDENAKAVRTSVGRVPPEVLDEARKLASMPQGKFAVDASLLEPTDLGDTPMRVLKVLELLRNDALLRAHDGECEEAAESCLALVHALGTLRAYPTMMGQMVRVAGQEHALDAIESTLAQGLVSAERLQAMQDALMAELRSAGQYSQALRSERAASHYFYELISVGEIPYSSVYGHTGLRAVLLDRFPGSLVGDEADYLRMMTDMVRAAKLKENAQDAAFAEVERKWNDSKDVNITTFMHMAMEQTREQKQIQARLRCAVTALAAERYRIEQGAWPSGAEDLVKAGLLKESLRDPQDGQPLRWKKTTSGGVIIYALGVDRIDHGGKLFNDMRQPGGDVGFELLSPQLRR